MQTLDDKQDWVNRLKKIEGQVRGLQNMLETNRSCADMMMQISSVKAALHQLGVKIFETNLQEEFQFIIDVDEQNQADEHIEELVTILSRSFK